MRHSSRFINSQFETFDSIMEMFLKEAPGIYSHPRSACFAVAGPCKDDVAKLTNGQQWVLNGTDISLKYGIKSVKVVNDFVASGYGLLTLNHEEDCSIIQVP
jgi:glucokinase